MAAGHHIARDFTQTPLNIYWEMTQACPLACRHCRAEAAPHAHPDQMTHAESLAFLRQIPEFGAPLPQLILTGGDPLQRHDLLSIVDEARRLGIGVAVTPAASPALTRERLADLQAHGVEGLGLSLDGSTAERHDGIRGVAGTFDHTLRALEWAQELGMPVQVNTLVAEETAEDLRAIFDLLVNYSVARWSLFFLISVGRGRVLAPVSPARADQLMRWIYATAHIAPFTVATTEAPSYRRVAIELMRAEGRTGERIRQSSAARSFGIRDGNGVMFVSHTGEVYPSGFLPLAVGNVRRNSLVQLYRNSELFRQLHDPTAWEGRCGECEFHALCGGSRARAYAATGNPLAADPLCGYQPHSRA